MILLHISVSAGQRLSRVTLALEAFECDPRGAVSDVRWFKVAASW